MPSQVKLIRENERKLVFAYPYHVASWIGILIGGGMFYMVCRSMVGGPIFLRWWMAIFGLVIALAGIAGSLYTDRLTLDLMTRTYTRRKGYLRKITTQSGSFDDIEGVALQVEYRDLFPRPANPLLGSAPRAPQCRFDQHRKFRK